MSDDMGYASMALTVRLVRGDNQRLNVVDAEGVILGTVHSTVARDVWFTSPGRGVMGSTGGMRQGAEKKLWMARVPDGGEHDFETRWAAIQSVLVRVGWDEAEAETAARAAKIMKKS